MAAEHWHLAQGAILDAVNFVGFDSLMARLTANPHLAFVAVQVGFAFFAVARTTCAKTLFAIARRFPNGSLGSERDLIARDSS